MPTTAAPSRSLASMVRTPSRGYPPSSAPPSSTMAEAKLLATEILLAAPSLLVEGGGRAVPGVEQEGGG